MTLRITSARFIASSPDTKHCPAPVFHEYAFIGRSNVGKSSLINRLVNKKGLAKTSSNPGKTKIINHFLINENWYLTDLPGYGYARVSKSDREKFGEMITDYLLNRPNLTYVFVLIDSRIEAQKLDINFMNWLGTNGIPFMLIFTKTDKVSGVAVDKNIANVLKTLRETWEEAPPFIKTSALTSLGCDKLLEIINQSNQQPVPNHSS